MKLLERLGARLRHRRRLRAARRDIRRTQRSIEARQRAANPGYDELRCPIFIGTMLLAVAVLVLDIREDISPSVIQEWARAAMSALGIARGEA